MKFLGWLLSQKDRNDDIGILARDTEFIRDGCKPRFYASEEEWHYFLDRHNACYDAHESLSMAWIEFRATVGIDPPRDPFWS